MNWILIFFLFALNTIVCFKAGMWSADGCWEAIEILDRENDSLSQELQHVLWYGNTFINQKE